MEVLVRQTNLDVSIPRRVYVLSGQSLTLGGSMRADYPLLGDDSLDGLCAELVVGVEECILKRIPGAISEIAINGARMSTPQMAVGRGDRIRIGQAEISVNWELGDIPSGPDEPLAAAANRKYQSELFGPTVSLYTPHPANPWPISTLLEQLSQTAYNLTLLINYKGAEQPLPEAIADVPDWFNQEDVPIAVRQRQSLCAVKLDSNRPLDALIQIYQSFAAGPWSMWCLHTAPYEEMLEQANELWAWYSNRDVLRMFLEEDGDEETGLIHQLTVQRLTEPFDGVCWQAPASQAWELFAFSETATWQSLGFSAPPEQDD
jgi:hypothetical protein